MPEASTSTAAKPRDQRRSRKRELFCSIHLEQLLAGGGRRNFLHLLSAEELSQRGMPAAKAKLLISAYAVYTLSNEWLEELFCHNCGMVGWAPRELWERVAHVEPLQASPSISDFSRREALRAKSNRRYWEP